MTSDQLVTAFIGLAIVSLPMARQGVRAYRNWHEQRDAETHTAFMDWLEGMRVAGEEQANDPRVAAIVRRFQYSVAGGARIEAPRGGRHRAVNVARRLATAAA